MFAQLRYITNIKLPQSTALGFGRDQMISEGVFFFFFFTGLKNAKDYLY